VCSPRKTCWKKNFRFSGAGVPCWSTSPNKDRKIASGAILVSRCAWSPEWRVLRVAGALSECHSSSRFHRRRSTLATEQPVIVNQRPSFINTGRRAPGRRRLLCSSSVCWHGVTSEISRASCSFIHPSARRSLVCSFHAACAAAANYDDIKWPTDRPTLSERRCPAASAGSEVRAGRVTGRTDATMDDLQRRRGCRSRGGRRSVDTMGPYRRVRRRRRPRRRPAFVWNGVGVDRRFTPHGWPWPPA